ncbi:MAG: PIN domain-containing protein [Deltaproteobacteria bacterium]|nr:PIN domain-containing protein [Deltaproteobacteria bacterium]
MVGGLKYLLNTNIILELLLEQEQAEPVARWLRQTPPELLHLSEFSLYSLGVILIRLKLPDVSVVAVNDLLASGYLSLVRLTPEDMSRVAEAAREFSLDFDDAYQYVAAERFDLALLSFDHDFDRTDRGRTTLTEVMEGK